MERAICNKIERVFGILAVDKRAALQGGLEGLPRYVTEYLLGAAKEQSTRLSLEEVQRRIQQYSLSADDVPGFISKLMRKGEAGMIALLTMEPKPEKGTHTGHIAQLSGHTVLVDAAYAERFPELLYAGLWGSAKLNYGQLREGSNKRYITLSDFVPYQLTNPNVGRFVRAREKFSLEEWTDLLVSSAGYNPDAFGTLRLKLLLLSRLVPLAQSNVNLLELGGRGTGKSYALRNLSPNVYLLAGARASPAELLYSIRHNRPGIIGRYKAVVFDEVASTKFSDLSLVASLKDYMESAQVSRGGSRPLNSECSLVLVGNLDLAPDGRGPSPLYHHLFEALPQELCDTAIADRIHAFIPGWEMPKIRDDVLSNGVGLLADYFGSILNHLRRDVQYGDHVRKSLEFGPECTIRDQTAITRVATGLLKMIFPDQQASLDEVRQVLDVAVELRQRVRDELHKMAPGEYSAAKLTAQPTRHWLKKRPVKVEAA